MMPKYQQYMHEYTSLHFNSISNVSMPSLVVNLFAIFMMSLLVFYLLLAKICTDICVFSL